MELTKPSAYLAQISIYLKNGDRESAYSMSKEFANKFPDTMTSHYLLALSALGHGKYEEAKMEGRKAFNLAATQEDMLTCALITGMAYYELKDYGKGYEILLLMESKSKTVELEKFLVMFSLAMNSPEAAARHEEELLRLNSRAALDLIVRIAGSR